LNYERIWKVELFELRKNLLNLNKKFMNNIIDVIDSLIFLFNEIVNLLP